MHQYDVYVAASISNLVLMPLLPFNQVGPDNGEVREEDGQRGGQKVVVINGVMHAVLLVT